MPYCVFMEAFPILFDLVPWMWDAWGGHICSVQRALVSPEESSTLNTSKYIQTLQHLHGEIMIVIITTCFCMFEFRHHCHIHRRAMAGCSLQNRAKTMQRVWRRCLSTFLYNPEIFDILESPWMFSLHPFVLNVCHARTARQGPQGAQGTQGANGASQLMPWKDQAVENARQGPPMGTAHRFHQHLGRKKSQKFQSCLLQETRCQQISTQILSIGQVRTRQRHMPVVFWCILQYRLDEYHKRAKVIAAHLGFSNTLSRWYYGFSSKMWGHMGCGTFHPAVRTLRKNSNMGVLSSDARIFTKKYNKGNLSAVKLLNQRAGVAQGGRNC